MSQDIFDNLISSITEKVLEQVQQQSQSVIAEAVAKRLDDMVSSDYISKSIEDRILKAVVQYQPDMNVVDESIRTLISQMGEGISTDLNSRTNRMISERVNGLDVTSLIGDIIDSKLGAHQTSFEFPEGSINAGSLDSANLKITGDNISGGVITNFGSTGIDDQASNCKVTILDQGTVFENTLYAPRIEVKGGALIDGDIDIQGRIVDSPAYQQLVTDIATSTKTILTDEVIAEHQDLLFKRIQEEGINLRKITVDGRLMIDGDRLVGVVNSQLRTVGTLQDLQTTGETLLSETLYASHRRVGINTMDPKSALSIWDEEVEIGIGKSQKGIGRIATERESDLVLGSNNQDNLTLKTDGSVVMNKLTLNNMTFTTSSTPPSHEAQRGTIVFNESPSLGGPLGWVSLGEARWANFGIID